MKILAIDSSSKPASASVINDGKLLGEVYINNGFTHSKTLMPVVNSVLNLTQTKLSEIDLCAVVTGPGSFTGVRIGVAAAKGLCFINDIACVGISTLECMAYNISCIDGYACSIMDARCSQVYTATFKCGEKIERITPDRAISIDELINHFNDINGKIYLLGDGAELVYNKCSDNQNLVLVNENNRYQKSSSAAFCAILKNEDDYLSSDELNPQYLRLPQAERELKNKLK